MTRYALAVSYDGARWVERIEGEYIPKVIDHHGTEYRVVIAMGTRYRRQVDAWWQAPNAATLSVVPNAGGR